MCELTKLRNLEMASEAEGLTPTYFEVVAKSTGAFSEGIVGMLCASCEGGPGGVLVTSMYDPEPCREYEILESELVKLELLCVAGLVTESLSLRVAKKVEPVNSLALASKRS